MSDTNPDYETLLRLRALETDPVQKAIYTEQAFQFNVPLTAEEAQVFDYVYVDYIEDNPDADGNSYVGIYFADNPEFTPALDNTVPTDRTHVTMHYDSNGIPLVSVLGTEYTSLNAGNFSPDNINSNLEFNLNYHLLYEDANEAF